MRSREMYLLAAALTLASVPIYVYIYRRTVSNVSADVTNPAARVARSSAELSRVPLARRNAEVNANFARAVVALSNGGAKCVSGVLYRTYDHVIEPWPGNVRCTDAGDPVVP